MQVQGAGCAMVGEQMPITIAITAADAVAQDELAVEAQWFTECSCKIQVLQVAWYSQTLLQLESKCQ